MGIETYTVKPGDTLSAIARRHYGHAALWPALFAYNTRPRFGKPPALSDPNRLRIGQRIYLPPRGSHHRPHQRNPRGYRHPAQVTHPAISPETAPAASAIAHAADPAKRPSASLVTPRARGRTHVNSFAFRYDLDLLPTIKGETPEFEFEAKYKGSLYLWQDRQIDILALTSKGAELAAKHQTDTALGQLVNSGKVSWDRATNRVTYENLMTVNAVGMPPSMTAIGYVLDPTNPMPTIRAKFTSPKIEGRLRPTFLYLAENITVTLDIRPKLPRPRGPDTAPANNFETIAPPLRSRPALASSGAPAHGTISAPDAGSSHPWWDRPSILLAGAAILTAATLASNVVTWGADSEVDPASLGLAGEMVRRAMAQ